MVPNDVIEFHADVRRITNQSLTRSSHRPRPPLRRTCVRSRPNPTMIAPINTNPTTPMSAATVTG